MIYEWGCPLCGKKLHDTNIIGLLLLKALHKIEKHNVFEQIRIDHLDKGIVKIKKSNQKELRKKFEDQV